MSVGNQDDMNKYLMDAGQSYMTDFKDPYLNYEGLMTSIEAEFPADPAIAKHPAEELRQKPQEQLSLAQIQAEFEAEQDRGSQLVAQEQSRDLLNKLAQLRADNNARERALRMPPPGIPNSQQPIITASQHAQQLHAERPRERGLPPHERRRDSPKTTALRQVEGMLSAHNKLKNNLRVVETSGQSAAGGSSSEETDGQAFSLASRDLKRGKPSAKCKSCDTHSQVKVGLTSGLKDQLSQKIVNKQKYPHAALQHEFMWGWAGNGLNFKDLTFGQFMAGELEIITSDGTLPIEAARRLELLKITAYRSQYLAWSKLLHLHAAILQKIEIGQATWSSDFSKIEQMVLENPGRLDWGARLGIGEGKGSRDTRDSRDSRERKPANSNTLSRAKVLWCMDYQNGSCKKSSPHEQDIRGSMFTVKHICKKCYDQDRVERAHKDRDAACPYVNNERR